MPDALLLFRETKGEKRRGEQREMVYETRKNQKVKAGSKRGNKGRETTTGQWTMRLNLECLLFSNIKRKECQLGLRSSNEET